VPTIEQVRTVLEDAHAYPTINAPSSIGDLIAQDDSSNNAYQQLANTVILVSLPIAGCTLAAGIATGLADAAVAIGTGFGAAAMYTAEAQHHPMVAPGAPYYLITAGGVLTDMTSERGDPGCRRALGPGQRADDRHVAVSLP
jgi:hypothetical protein